MTLPPAIAIEIRRRICASRFLTRLATANRQTRANLAKNIASSYGVPRVAVSRLLLSIELAALADAQDRAALSLAAQLRAANAGEGPLPWAMRRREMDEHPKKPRQPKVAK